MDVDPGVGVGGGAGGEEGADAGEGGEPKGGEGESHVRGWDLRRDSSGGAATASEGCGMGREADR